MQVAKHATTHRASRTRQFAGISVTEDMFYKTIKLSESIYLYLIIHKS